MRLYELLESRKTDTDQTLEGDLSPLSQGHKKLIDIIGLGSLLGRNFLRCGPNGDNAKKRLRQVGMYRPELEIALTALGKEAGANKCCKNEILDWIEINEPETYAELRIGQLSNDPCTGKPTARSRQVYDNTDGRLSPISRN